MIPAIDYKPPRWAWLTIGTISLALNAALMWINAADRRWWAFSLSAACVLMGVYWITYDLVQRLRLRAENRKIDRIIAAYDKELYN